MYYCRHFVFLEVDVWLDSPRYRFARYPLAVIRIYKTKTHLTPSDRVLRQETSVSPQKPSK